MAEENQRSEELFEALSRKKKKRRRKIIRTVLIVLVSVVVIAVAGLAYLRRQVERRFASDAAEVLSYSVETGTIHTVVSGTGTLTEEDTEDLTVPAGVEITEVLVDAGDVVAQGDVLATVDMSTVMTALSSVQDQLDDLDDDIAAAKDDSAGTYVSAGISGRVKILYAESGDDVAACMAEHGALAILSLDGYMAVDIETGSLTAGDEVTVVLSDGTEKDAAVDAVVGTTATVLVTDNGPAYDETVLVRDADGTDLGSGNLYIHNPLAVTGYAGTISRVNTSLNAQVYSGSTLFTLKDTSISASYDSLLRSRGDLEETLLQLLTIYRDGAVLAQMDASVSTVSYDEDAVDESTETALLTLYPRGAMSITISVDETDILSLEVDQQAEVVVSSVSDETMVGTVTEISKVATTSSGVTLYSAVVTVDWAEGMLSGMTAEVDVQIQGVEGALIIPVDALHQTSAISYVYTSYDEQTQQYGGMVEVTTGMRNDSYVEILSGLNEGDTVYYTETETFNFMDMFGGGMGGMSGGMGGMGDMGSGGGRGEMPSGGFGGGMPSGGPNMGG